MEIDIYGKGMPKTGIPPLDKTNASQIPAVARKIIDYVRNQASEEGLDIRRDYKRGRGYQLRMVLERTAQSLLNAYLGIGISTNMQVFQQFDESLDKIIELLQSGTLAENSRKRKVGIKECHERSFLAEEAVKSLLEVLSS